MFRRSNAYKRSDEYARKQEEQNEQQKHKRDSEGSGSFRMKKSAVKTSMPEIDVILAQPFQSVEMDDNKLPAELAPLWGDSFTLAEEPSLTPSSSVGTLATSTYSLVKESPIAPPHRQAPVAGRPRPPRRTRSASTPSSVEILDSDRYWL
jgi:hypothetical protein